MSDYLSYLFVFYAVFLIGFVIYSIAGIYHLWRFGYEGDFSKTMIAIYLAVSASVIILSIMLMIFLYSGVE